MLQAGLHAELLSVPVQLMDAVAGLKETGCGKGCSRKQLQASASSTPQDRCATPLTPPTSLDESTHRGGERAWVLFRLPVLLCADTEICARFRRARLKFLCLQSSIA